MEREHQTLQTDTTTIDVVNVGVIVLDQDSSIIQWNRWMEKYSGFIRSDVIGKSIRSVFPEVESLRFFSAISQAIKSGNASILAQSIHNSPLPLFDRSEVKLAQAIEIQPLKIDSQKEFHCLIQVSNVGSAVRREEQLRKHALELSKLVAKLSESESRTKAIVDISGDGVVTINDQGLIESINPRAEQIFGCTEEEMRNQSVAQFFSPAYAEQLPSFIRQFARHGGLMQAGEWRMMEAKRKEGEIFPINLNLTTTKLAGQNQIVGIVRDLTELEESERALQESHDILEMALESGESWVWDWKVSSGQACQDRMMQMLGYAKSTFGEDVMTWIDLVHPDDWPEVGNKMKQHLEGFTSSFDCEYRLFVKEKEHWIWVHDQGKVVARDEQGHALRVIGINQKITRRKLAEIDATKASEQAIEAAKVKSEFLGNMSHELRTPMNGIMGVLNILKLSSPTEEQLEYIDVAKRSAESLLKTIDNVLDFSKLGEKSVHLELVDFDPEEVLKDVVKLLSESAYVKAITLDYMIEKNMFESITTDPVRLRQILINLLGNAIKFTHEGYVQIRLLRTESDNLLFEVEDSGVGIPEDRQDVIFDAFAQADVSTTRKYGGTGLGLGISKELVELMGGRLMVESEPDKGSVFSFTIKNHDSTVTNFKEDEKELA